MSMERGALGMNCTSASALVLGVLRELVSEATPGYFIKGLTEEGAPIPDVPPSWERVGPRGMATRELQCSWYRLMDVSRCMTWLPGRNLNYPFMVAEWLWMFMGRDDVEMIGYYNENIKKFSDDGAHFFGAYGPRWRGQIGGCVDRLRKDPDSRQGVVSMWRRQYQQALHTLPASDSAYMTTRDVPCTMTMQYLIRGGRLHASVCMRSSDTWLGLPYDLFNFAMLQRCVASELQLPAGTLTLYIGSSHLYESNLDQAREVVRLCEQRVWDDITTPEPPGLGYLEIQRMEEYVRQGDYVVEAGAECWAPWLTLLSYRRNKDQLLVSCEFQRLLWDALP